MLKRLCFVVAADHNQGLLRSRTARWGSSTYATLNDFYDDRSLFTVADFDFRPRILWQRFAPFAQALKRNHRSATLAVIRRRVGLLITDQRIAGNLQQILFAQVVQIAAKTIGTTHFLVPRDPGVRQSISTLPKHLQG